MQVKCANTRKVLKPQPVLSDDNRTFPPMTTETITVFDDQPTEEKVTATEPTGKIHRNSKVTDFSLHINHN